MTSDQVTTGQKPLMNIRSITKLAALAVAGLMSLLIISACGQNSDTTDSSSDRPSTDEPAAGATASSAGDSAVAQGDSDNGGSDAGNDGGDSTPSTDDAAAGQAEDTGESAGETTEGAFGEPLDPAKDIDELNEPRAPEPQPISISIERLGLTQTTVLPVGIEDNGDMEVPPPLDVGWYRYGPMPGEEGSAVLAGHIASEGIDGAFRYLDRLEPGDTVSVDYDNGETVQFVVNEKFQVGKNDLPFDRLFARSGAPQLALITCGGEFNYDARSYEDNIVVTADLA